MDSFKTQYEKAVSERERVMDRLQSLKQDDIVQIYLDLCEREVELQKQQKSLYREMKLDEYSDCDHIWVRIFEEYDSWEDRSYHSCGCIKCGLDQRVLDEEEKYYD